MKILFLGKSYPEREITWSKGLKKIDKNIEITIIEFSKKNFLDLNKEKIEKEIEKINFIAYLKKEYQYYKFLKDSYILNELKKYEKKYTMNYNYILNCDRTLIKYSKERRKLYLLILTKFAENILKNKYDKVVGEFSSSSDLIFYYICKKNNIKHLSFSHGRMKNKISIDNINGERKGLKELYNELKSRSFTKQEKDILEKYLEKVKEKDIIPDYEKNNKKGRKFSLKREIFLIRKNFKNNLLAYREDKNFSCDQAISFRAKLIQRFDKLKYPIKKYINRKFWDSIMKNEKYLLVPLHYQPEASTMTFAQEYLDQIHHIACLSQVIPIDYYLYVKEHPSMYIYRDKKYYNKLKSFHNVKLISPFEDQLNLLKESRGVVTLTNTTGYEAILYQKPVYLFGKVFYQVYDHVNKIEKYSELRNIIEKNEDFYVNKHNYEAFILATLLSLRKGNYNLITLDSDVGSEENGLNIAQIILEE